MRVVAFMLPLNLIYCLIRPFDILNLRECDLLNYCLKEVAKRIINILYQ